MPRLVEVFNVKFNVVEQRPLNLRTRANTVRILFFAVVGVLDNVLYVDLRQWVHCKKVVCNENKPRGIY